jgi:hypothetical protein
VCRYRSFPESAGHDAAAEETTARDPLVEAEVPLADAEAVGVRDGKAGIAGDHAEVGHVGMAVQRRRKKEQPEARIARLLSTVSLGEAFESEILVDRRIPQADGMCNLHDERGYRWDVHLANLDLPHAPYVTSHRRYHVGVDG